MADKLKGLLAGGKKVKGMEDVPFEDIEDIEFTIGTELEFWVKTPSEKETIQHLSISQRLQEQYWQRMRGNVRTAMEEAIEELDARGMSVEMGHKEVGGIKPKVDDAGHTVDVCEQLELDWRFSMNPCRQQTMNWKPASLSVKYSANTAWTYPSRQSHYRRSGSGEHTHVGICATLKNGKTINLLAPTEMKADFLSTIGYGFIMGILKNYEATNPSYPPPPTPSTV